MAKITFLGTGGGRFATIYQTRSTGGIYVQDGLNLHIDPGPGALVTAHKMNLDPTKTDVILVSHRHPDHFCDTEILIEAMTKGCTERRGMLIAAETVTGAISKYHKSFVDVKTIRPDDEVRTKDLSVRITRAWHSDPMTVGFNIRMPSGPISYIPDTEFRPAIAKPHKGTGILILCVTRPLNARIEAHLCTEDSAELVREINPKLTILTHFGLRMLRNAPVAQADWVWKNTGVKTLAAEDGMQLAFDDVNADIEIT